MPCHILLHCDELAGVVHTLHSTRRFFGFFLVYILQILLLLLLAAVTYSVLLLLTQYRCSVLISSLIIPFFCYEVYSSIKSMVVMMNE
jgi:hypothetical protein